MPDTDSVQRPVRTYREALREWQAQYFAHLLYIHEGEVRRAAKAIGMNRTQFYKSIKPLGLYKPKRAVNRGNDNWQRLGSTE
jgi:DNA-binding NtrC family response regulator